MSNQITPTQAAFKVSAQAGFNISPVCLTCAEAIGAQYRPATVRPSLTTHLTTCKCGAALHGHPEAVAAEASFQAHQARLMAQRGMAVAA